MNRQKDKDAIMEKLLYDLYPNHPRMCSMYLKHTKKNYISYIASLEISEAYEPLRKQTCYVFNDDVDDATITEANVVRRMVDCQLLHYRPTEKDSIMQFLCSFTDNDVIRISGIHIHADELISMFEDFKIAKRQELRL